VTAKVTDEPFLVALATFMLMKRHRIQKNALRSTILCNNFWGNFVTPELILHGFYFLYFLQLACPYFVSEKSLSKSKSRNV
jgi:hypothetical protein